MVYLPMGRWVMGHSFEGSHGSWVTARDPFAALPSISIQSPRAVLVCATYRKAVKKFYYEYFVLFTNSLKSRKYSIKRYILIAKL